MDLYLHFILVNTDYNQSIADDYNNGEESEDNVKHIWEDELKVAEPITDFKIIHSKPYVLKGYYPNDVLFEFEIPNVTLVECNTVKGEKIQFAVSKKLIKTLDKQEVEGKDETHITFYLKDDVSLQNPFEGLYIDTKDFPKELLKTTTE
jgi:hypothetical protein